jgi:hypothetical protein
LLFPPVTGAAFEDSSTLYNTSHLFVFGDLNFRVSLPDDHEHKVASRTGAFARVLESYMEREKLREYDQLFTERKKGTTFIGLREGNFWNFKCSYKYVLGEVDEYRYLDWLRFPIQLYLTSFGLQYQTCTIVDRPDYVLDVHGRSC